MSSASGSGSSDSIPVATRGKKRRKKRNKTTIDSDAEEPQIKSENCPLASKMPSENEADSNESLSSSSSSSSSESESDSESIISLPPALDGGWGWIVVIGSFFAHFLCDGLAYNAGIIYEHLHDTFHTGASETAWVSSVFLAVPYLLGPFAGAFVDRYGCRAATITGAIIGCIGCVLSYFVDSLAWLCITFGVIFGLGQALVLFASSVIVPYYFEERRSLAYGLAVSGSGIGTAVLAPLLKKLMYEYDWRGMMLILGGLSLNLAVCGALYRPLATREFKRKFRSKRNLEKFENMSRMSRESSLFVAGTPPTARIPDSDFVGDEHSASVTDKLLPQLNGLFRQSGDLEIITEDLNATDVPSNMLGSSPPAFTRSCDVVTFDNYTSADLSAQVPTISTEINVVTTKSLERRRKRSKNPREVRLVPVARPQPHTIAPLSRVDIFYRGSVINNNNPSNSNLISSQRRVRALSCPHLAPLKPVKPSWQTATSDFFIEVGDSLRRMGSISIMRRPLFFWFWLSNFLFYMWFEVPLNYIPEFTTKLTGSEHNDIIVIIIGLVTCFGQVVFGYLCDKEWMSSLLLYGVGVTITGLSTLFMPLITNYWGLSIYAFVFTFGSCGNTALDTTILTELLGIKRLTNSYGLLMVGQGIASLFGAPLAGYIIDLYDKETYGELQGYVVCFMHTGAWLVVSGVMIGVITPFYKRLRRWNPCKPEEGEDESVGEEETKQSLSNRDLETGKPSPPSSAERRKRASTVVVTTTISSRLGVVRVHKNGGGSSGIITDHSRQTSPFDCGHSSSSARSRSVSTSELNVFPPTQALGSVAKESEISLKNNQFKQKVEVEAGRLNDSSVQETSQSALSESVSSATTAITTTTTATPPTYAETAVGYVEYREGWADTVYKDRSLSVI